MICHSFEEWKYTLKYRDGLLTADRYGEPWRDLTGDKLVGSLLTQYDDTVRSLAEVTKALEAAQQKNLTLAASLELHSLINRAKALIPENVQ